MPIFGDFDCLNKLSVSRYIAFSYRHLTIHKGVHSFNLVITDPLVDLLLHSELQHLDRYYVKNVDESLS